jgi:hypothetical protein
MANTVLCIRTSREIFPICLKVEIGNTRGLFLMGKYGTAVNPMIYIAMKMFYLFLTNVVGHTMGLFHHVFPLYSIVN